MPNNANGTAKDCQWIRKLSNWADNTSKSIPKQKECKDKLLELSLNSLDNPATSVCRAIEYLRSNRSISSNPAYIMTSPADTVALTNH